MNNENFKKCDRCGALIRLVKTKHGWRPYEWDVFLPHKDGDPVDEALRIFNPKDNPWKKGLWSRSRNPKGGR